jgi:hypothetical protein
VPPTTTTPPGIEECVPGGLYWDPILEAWMACTEGG